MNKLARIHAFLLPAERELGWTPYLWLFYLLFFFMEWYFQTPTVQDVLLMTGTVLVFLPIYFSGFRRTGRAALMHVAAITLIAMVWTPFNIGASVFYIYAASFACTAGRFREGLMIILMIMAMALAMWVWFQPSIAFLVPAVVFSFIVGIANLFYTEQSRKNAELRLSQAEVRRLARIAERERIARDLHDVLGHTLSLIVLKSELANRLLEQKPEAAREEILSIEGTARKALGEVRQAISGFHEMSLEEAIEQAQLSLRSADIELKVEVDDDIDLTDQATAMLSLVIREAVTNIIRHADARRCVIRLSQDHERCLLDISDDGKGRIRADGSGVQGMRARIESLHGELMVKPGQLVASFPAVLA